MDDATTPDFSARETFTDCAGMQRHFDIELRHAARRRWGRFTALAEPNLRR